ncbi:hypothetical protein MMC30_007762 [Trapelia coarctata]|nr:hypothetical protein [Trapelia coarctata]
MLGILASSNSTQVVLDSVLLAKAMQHRMSTIITGAFNIVTALLVIASILWNAYSTKGGALDLRLPLYRRAVHSTQIFPFFTSIAVIIQGVVFVAVQSSALSSFGVADCRATAELVWPALWLFSFTVLAFGVETAVRSIRRNALCARGTWETWLVIGFISLLTLMMWLSSFLLPESDDCVGALVWWTENYALIAIVLIPIIIIINSVTSSIIVVQLLRTSKVDKKERIMASRVVYTISLSIIILALLLPYYIEVFTNRTPDNFTNPTVDTTSDIADIALNLPGIVNAVLHIMLVNDCDRMAIQSWRNIPKQQGEAQLLGPTEFDADIVTPVSPPLGPSRPSDLALIGADNGRSPSRPNTIRTRYTGPQPPLRRPSSFAELTTSPQREMRNQSRYSIFPTRASQRPVSWSTIPTRSDHESVQLPPPLFASRYTRNNSDGSSATVQIGLRLSDTGQEESNPPNLVLSPRQDMWDNPTVLRRTIQSMSEYSDESPELSPATPKLHTSRSHRSMNRSSLTTLSSHWEEQRQQMMTKSLPPIPPLPSPGVPPTPRLNQHPIPPVPPLLFPGIPPTPQLNQSPITPGPPLYSPGIPPTPRLNQYPLPRADMSNNPRFTVMSIGLPATPRPLTVMSVGLPPTPRLSIPRLPTPRIVDHPPMPTEAANWSPMTRDNWI